MSHVLRYAARTDRGLLRANNQDSVFAGDRLLVIADGMGGHAAGDVASRLVVAAFVDLDELPLGSDMVRPLTDATREGNAAIAEMVGQSPELDGMGTTLTALLFDGAVVALAHVGDSRAYLYRNGVLHQISHDDTFVQSLVDDGRITAEEAAHHPQRSLLLRALNGTEMDPSITLRETSAGDRFLICSDGLSDVVSPEAIADALAGPDPDSVADTLVQLALVAGGPDNVTVIVADVVETGGNGGFGVPAGIDPEATGPMQPIHLTQKMPRVPLPPIPEDPPAKAEYAPDDDLADGQFDDEDEDGDEDGFDDDDAFGDRFDGPGDSPRAAGGSSPVGRRDDRRMLTAPAGAHRGRRWALALSLVVLAAIALTGANLWAGSKYYVGDNDDQVAVFRGVNGSLLGWKFASVQENSCGAAGTPCTPLKVRDLVQAARDQVTAGIPVATLADARAVMTRLTSQQLPPCPAAGGPATGSALTGVAPSGAVTKVAPSGAGTNPSSAGQQPSQSTRSAATATTATTATAATPATTAPAKPTAPANRAGTTARTATRASASRSAARAVPPGPAAVTTTITVTLTTSPPTTSPLPTPASGAAAGRRLRADAPAAAPAPARTTPRAITSRLTPAPSTPRRSTARPATTPRVTVRTTVTTISTPTSTGTPLVSPAAVPGVNCRPVP